MIKITYKNGEETWYEPQCYTEYKYDGKCFIVIYKKQWIGIYNMDCIASVQIVDETEIKF